MKGSGMGLCAPLEAARINAAGDGYDWKQLGWLLLPLRAFWIFF